MKTLIFQLQAPLSSWGDVAVGEYRPTSDYPTQSAIQGLLAAALGIARASDIEQQAMCGGYRIAVGVLDPGRLLRDYHTTQVPGRSDLKKWPHATRKDELSLPKDQLNTILSTRDYRQDAAYLVAVQTAENAAYSLQKIVNSLNFPKFSLCLGRKSCPIAVPLHPCIIESKNIYQAFLLYQSDLVALWLKVLPAQVAPPNLPIVKIAWGDNFGVDDMDTIGVVRDVSFTRKDQVITRQGWQFSDRYEHVAILVKE